MKKTFETVMKLAIPLLLAAIFLAVVWAGFTQSVLLEEIARDDQIPIQAQGLWAQTYTFHTSAVTNANGTAVNVRGYPLVSVQVQGVTTATINWETTGDGTNWDAVQAVDSSDGSKATTTTADGQFWVPVGGKRQLRARISGYSGGTITITGFGVTAPASVNMADVEVTTSSGLEVIQDTAADLNVTADTELAAAAALADAAANPTVPTVGGAELLYNEATWDKSRNNVEATLLESTARVTTTNSADTVNYNHTALAIFIDVSSITASPSVTPQLEWKDPVSGDYEPIWIATVAIVGTGEYIYLFDLGGLGSAGEYDEAVNIRIPRTFRLTMTHADSDSITYSVGIALML